MKKRSVIIAGHASSITIEEPFWLALKEIAAEEGCSLNSLVTQIDDSRAAREGVNLSSAVRLYILDRLQKKIARTGG